MENITLIGFICKHKIIHLILNNNSTLHLGGQPESLQYIFYALPYLILSTVLGDRQGDNRGRKWGLIRFNNSFIYNAVFYNKFKSNHSERPGNVLRPFLFIVNIYFHVIILHICNTHYTHTPLPSVLTMTLSCDVAVLI